MCEEGGGLGRADIKFLLNTRVITLYVNFDYRRGEIIQRKIIVVCCQIFMTYNIIIRFFQGKEQKNATLIALR